LLHPPYGTNRDFCVYRVRKPSSVDDWSVSRVFASHADAASGERSDHIRDEGIKIVAWAALSRLSGQMPILHL
jgi:hypothetical protein